MNIYAVFLPSQHSGASSAEKAELVRQGFDWSAFLVTPLWALRRGNWLALALWLGWIFATALIAWLANLGSGTTVSLYALGAIAFGLEADRLSQAKLSRTGFLLHGLTLGESTGEAESLYFGGRPDLVQAPRWRSEAQQTAASVSDKKVGWPDPTGGTDLLGLFPPQETKR